MANKTIWLVIILSALPFLYLPGVNLTRADDGNGIDQTLNGVVSTLPAPVTDLINAGKQTWQNLISGISISALSPVNPTTGSNISFKDMFENANSWLVQTTGLNLIQIVKAIGGFVVWVLSLAAELIRQGLSLIS